MDIVSYTGEDATENMISTAQLPQMAPPVEDSDTWSKPTGLVYAANEEHSCKGGKRCKDLQIERPERVSAIMERMTCEGLVARCCHVGSRDATLEELCAVHTEAHVQEMKRLPEMESQVDMNAVADCYNSIYLSQGSFASARRASGGVTELVKRVVDGDMRNGLAVIRPPGHHAEGDQCCGFCVFNNVAIAAATARSQFGVEKVLIVDWDVHHGNGTQHIFEADPSVLYFSIHRYDNGDFFPCSKDAAPEVVGRGAGEGANINVAWNIAWKDDIGMGDDEYLAAWSCVLLPIAQEFQPQLILVSAGFDSAVGERFGCSVTPAGFAQMTKMLEAVCSKIVLVLEGGYELGSISECMCACTRTLLGDKVHSKTRVQPKKEARLSIERTLRAHRRFWSSLSLDNCVMSNIWICLHNNELNSLAEGLCPSMQDGEPSQDSSSLTSGPLKAVRRKKRREKKVTGVSISTRNAAEGNWKGDVRKLARKEAELKAVLESIDASRIALQRGSKLSRKNCVLLEEEDDIKWQLEEVTCQLQELDMLSRDDVLRMYAGCK